MDIETKDLSIVILELNNKIEILLEKQEEMAENVAKIKEAIYHPDQGIFSRLRGIETWRNMLETRIEERLERISIREGDLRLNNVEATVSAIKRIQWMIVAAVVTTATSLIIKTFIIA